ncbi:MAG TPA: hypothetical protein DEB06_00980 [Phycisphaerales bacterium]|nr:hypothetical protein [Phycisphaerales bacterium]
MTPTRPAARDAQQPKGDPPLMNAKAADTTSKPKGASVVDNAIREISHIATLPEITLKIVELVEDPTSTAQDLHQVIANDPALCSRILKVVNSSFYGLPGQIGSINRAIVLLGLNAVKNIAISASLAKLFKGGQLCPAFSAKDLWAHSVHTAAAAKIIADQAKLGLPDEAFLAGLMHDIGVMVELQVNRNGLIEVMNNLKVSKEGVPSLAMLDLEQKAFGATHQEFGKALSEKWKFPKVFAAVTGNHHAPHDAPSEARTLVSVVYVADRLAGELTGGYRLDLPSLDIDPSISESLKLTDKALAEIRENLAQQSAEVESLLN